MEKSVEGSCQDQHDCKDDPKTSKKRSAVASPKLGASRGTNRDKQVDVGDQSDKSQPICPTQLSKIQPIPVMKRKMQKTAGPKVPPVYNLRSRDQKTEGAKDSPAYNLRSQVRKTEGQNASTVIQKRTTPKKDSSKDSSVAIQKRGIPKIEVHKTPGPKSCARPIKKTESTKPLTTSLAGHVKKNQPAASQYEPYFRDPIYHIRWEGHDMEHVPFGQNCILCNKDLSGVTRDDDSGSHEHLQYEDEDDDDGEYEYDDDFMPRLLPAVDILSCGHAFHTECLQHGTPEEQSSDPQCVLCKRMA